MITAIVLAAGKSSRMGEENKMLLPFRSTTIIGAVLAALNKSLVDEIIVVDRQFSNLGSLIENNSSVQVVMNKDAEKGLTTSVQCGVNAASELSKGYLICLGDMPLLTSEDYNILINRFIKVSSKVIILPIHNNKRGNPVLFSQHFKEDILGLQDKNGCRPIVLQYPEHVVEVDFSTNHNHLDIDTREDYQRLT